mmetsp:Transcript_13743/g.34537  ORF Transcript_13743/g.34537 Transcript_13743/m.34537 type:complete len:82 (+) Transcript_13743:1016-1261(+)
MKRRETFSPMRIASYARAILIGSVLFFQTYLPKNFEHVCKKKKIVNGGMVGFTLCHTKVKATGEDKYMIDPTSLTVLYAGF